MKNLFTFTLYAVSNSFTFVIFFTLTRMTRERMGEREKVETGGEEEE